MTDIIVWTDSTGDIPIAYIFEPIAFDRDGNLMAWKYIPVYEDDQVKTEA